MIKHKMIIQINALFHITVFIWKIMFISAQQIYSTVIKLMLIYESAVWHFFSFLEQEVVVSHTVKSITIKLTNVQNRCLQVISEIYKIMSIAVLETETYISSLDLHLNIKLTKFCQHHKQLEIKKLIIKSCRQIQIRLQLQYSELKFTVSKCQIQWAEYWFKSEERMKVSVEQALLHRWKCCWTDRSSK